MRGKTLKDIAVEGTAPEKPKDYRMNFSSYVIKAKDPCWTREQCRAAYQRVVEAMAAEGIVIAYEETITYVESAP